MKDVLIIGGICVAAIAIGAGLYVYGPDEFRTLPEPDAGTASATPSPEAINVPQDISFAVLDEGQNAADMPTRKNYVVGSDTYLKWLWTTAYGADAPDMPGINFDEEYVIGVFAGEQSSGGHGIRVISVTDADTVRMVKIEVTRPGAGCVVTDAITSPYQLIRLPASSLPLEKEYVERVEDCE
jgi:hypothetical protein